LQGKQTPVCYSGLDAVTFGAETTSTAFTSHANSGRT